MFLSRRAVVISLLILASSAVPALAHEDHNELGAGPGPAAQEVSATSTNTAAAQMHESMAASHEQAVEHHQAVADNNKTFGQRLVSWLGRLHTLLVHFPIAMFVGALGVELYGLWKRDSRFAIAVRVMLIVGTVGALVAAALGWFAGGFYLTDRNLVLMTHRWLGTAIAALGLVLVVSAVRAHRNTERPRTSYWLLLGAMTIAIAVQGYIGGSFMHGGMSHLAF